MSQNKPPCYQPKPKFGRTPSLTINLDKETRDSFFWHRKSFMIPQNSRKESFSAYDEYNHNDSSSSISLSKSVRGILNDFITFKKYMNIVFFL